MAFSYTMSFTFKQFHIDDTGCGQKVGTDSVLLGAWAAVAQAVTIVDLGAGSGLLALMCAQRNSEATITAVEIDLDACLCAERNIKASPWGQRISLVQADAMKWAPKSKIDLIITNPPYFTSALQSPSAARAQARHANTFGPIGALVFASKNLSVNGILAMVTPAEIEQDLIFEATMLRLNLTRICHVRSSQRKPFTRILTQWSPSASPTIKESLTIASQDYKALTSLFYL